MKQKTLFRGIATALATPMTSSGAIDYDAYGRLIDWQIESGVAGLVTCGTTGEASTMTAEEHRQTIAFAVKRAAGRVPVIAGSGSNSTETMLEKSLAYQKIGVDGLLIITPYYNKASQSGLVQHFSAIADAVDIPVILYNVPSRTGVGCTAQTYQALAKHPNIAGVKEASDDFDLIQDTLNLCPPDFTVWSGNDGSTAAIMALGGKGVISVAANVVPREMHELTQLCLENRFLEAGTLQLKLHELIRALFCEVNPIPVKTSMELLGLCGGELRLPLCRMSERHLEQLSHALEPFRPAV